MSAQQQPPTFADIIDTAIAGCFPNDWDEDFITRTWLKSLRDQFGKRPLRFRNGTSVLFDCNKLTKIASLEQNHGDIAFLVMISAPSGEYVIGFASLEAKRTYPGRTGFKYPEFRKEQLRTHLTYSSLHRLLLYSHTLFPNTTTHAIALPALIGLLCSNNAAALDSSGGPLATQVSRYLHGWDLDFSPHIIERVLSGDDRFGHLLRAHVGLSQNIELSLERLEIPSNLYEDIGTPDIDLDLGLGGPLPELPPKGPTMGGFSL